MTYDIALPSEVRRALLVEHARIARLLAELEDLADRVRMGDDTGGRFDTVAHQLRRMLVDHNQAEEMALKPLLRVVDSWGPVRVEASTRPSMVSSRSSSPGRAPARRGRANDARTSRGSASTAATRPWGSAAATFSSAPRQPCSERSSSRAERAARLRRLPNPWAIKMSRVWR